jgi:thioredoxin 1
MFLERLFVICLFAIITVFAFVLFKQMQIRRINFATSGFVGGQPTLLYFRSDSCGTCPAQARYLDQLVDKENGRFAIQSIDVDIEPEKAKQYGVMTLPTTMILDTTGQVKEINYGLTPSHKLQKQLALVG